MDNNQKNVPLRHFFQGAGVMFILCVIIIGMLALASDTPFFGTLFDSEDFEGSENGEIIESDVIEPNEEEVEEEIEPNEEEVEEEIEPNDEEETEPNEDEENEDEEDETEVEDEGEENEGEIALILTGEDGSVYASPVEMNFDADFSSAAFDISLPQGITDELEIEQIGLSGFFEGMSVIGTELILADELYIEEGEEIHSSIFRVTISGTAPDSTEYEDSALPESGIITISVDGYNLFYAYIRIVYAMEE